MQTSIIYSKLAAHFSHRLREGTYRKLASTYNIAGYKRIYVIHIRKAGGTSLIHMFMSTVTPDAQAFRQELNQIPDHTIVRDNKIFVGWNARLINKGNYYCAFSHLPLRQL